MAETLKRLFCVIVPCMAIVLLSACGGRSSGVATYDVSATAGSGGTISPSNATVNAGGTTTFTVTSSSGYAISGVTGCGGTLSGATYTTAAISANCTVTASFVAQYTVTATAATGGSISPSSATVDAGGTTTFTLTPNSGYVINTVTGCGGTLSGATYTTAAISANCTVTAGFSVPFTWLGGSSTANVTGTYGTQGVVTAANVPGSRAFGVTWTDARGNLWMFGGTGLDSTSGAGGYLNDLWEYSPSSGEWTWIGGSSVADAEGVYGTQGVAEATDMPGARAYGVSWTDADGNLWLFGGIGHDSSITLSSLNDLWVYSPSRAEWTWVGGSSIAGVWGVYGAQGVGTATNMPGARHSSASWTDSSGNLWLFGGEGYGSPGGFIGYLNDLWKYSLATGEWTWVSGSNNSNATAVYGSQGVAASTDVPGARDSAVTWTDAGGNLWLFGGYGFDSSGKQGELNDLWEYSPASGEWIWISGSSTVNSNGVYGTQGVAASTNVPGARDSAVAWADASGNLWLFGGERLDTIPNIDLNDLWEYSPSSDEWTWVGGSSSANAKGVYGSQGVAANTNVPGARYGAFAWKPASGNAWLFGGYGFESGGFSSPLNDLWKYSVQ